jgi:hypothetical protein
MMNDAPATPCQQLGVTYDREWDLHLAEMHRAEGRDRLADIREMTPDERVVALIHASSLLSDAAWADGMAYVEASQRLR